MNKKTNFPDLERLPPHNHFKHFFDWLISKPRMNIEDIISEGLLIHYPSISKKEKEEKKQEIER